MKPETKNRALAATGAVLLLLLGIYLEAKFNWFFGPGREPDINITQGDPEQDGDITLWPFTIEKRFPTAHEQQYYVKCMVVTDEPANSGLDGQVFDGRSSRPYETFEDSHWSVPWRKGTKHTWRPGIVFKTIELGNEDSELIYLRVRGTGEPECKQTAEQDYDKKPPAPA